MSEGITVTQLTTFVITVIGFLVVVGVALIIILSKKREDVQLTDQKRADASEKLLKTRDLELEDCNKLCEKCREELEDVTAEYRALSGVNLAELVEFWKDYKDWMVEHNKLKRQLRIAQAELDTSGPPNS